MVAMLWTVAMLVLPELLPINGVSKWWIVPMLYPFYNMVVDGDGQASCLAPNVLYALRFLQNEQVPLEEGAHMVGPLIGGVFAGFLMATFFPDAPSI
eukprot:CAMPEP_0118677108 /NCGR_PEP_ID=MMETSP0800-20121206/2434_1 /TAXON_ID=210618 ORGANISM="Striatella unipunctata, Strain CCMP2910" /NCGR_SAMPLE_ID=MMETSP0800 /ASSEMBLY_ACC=CAM_ASM_000638 /LENGTH=96 /DNA_ID=CAMNT_0006572725 /DNA_START=248 /DNA_END=538 /DNA_ORIENTATION=-